MARFLIVYGTNEGQTRKIARYIAARLEAKGHEAHLGDASADPPPRCHSTDYDAYIVGGSIHEGRHQRSVVHFVKENLEDLMHFPSAFFSVSMTAAVKTRENEAEARKYIDSFLDETDWHPDLIASFAGALLYTQYDFLKRMLMKMIVKHKGGDTDTSHDYEYTNWEDVDRFVDAILPPMETATDSRIDAASAEG